ncbi:hypothetical protein [Nesterenkonia sp. HG001]|uniref:hypothetical protein n=1 Tax=Nesterenkonia sp. HG001 TaxID=2983207 RepID=UPI002AC3FAE1|nr:hypothetical protein [Nesterenkonia sp. HG001]MDZ5079013.1 hypothetical protein [Nesterenkonia sp. HG001]
MGLEKFGPFVVEAVAFGDLCLTFALGGGEQLVELAGDQFAERGNDVLGYLHASVVVLDCGFYIGHEHGLAVTVGALGVSAGADEVGIDDSAAALGVGQDQA